MLQVNSAQYGNRIEIILLNHTFEKFFIKPNTNHRMDMMEIQSL